MDEALVKGTVARAGSVVREARREAGMTQAQLASEALVSRSTVAEIEAGTIPNGPRIGTLARLLFASGEKLGFEVRKK